MNICIFFICNIILITLNLILILKNNFTFLNSKTMNKKKKLRLKNLGVMKF